MTKLNYTHIEAELDLWSVLLDSEDVAYPWSPEKEESYCYFEAVDNSFPLSDCLSNDDLSQRSQIFFDGIEKLWPRDLLYQFLVDKLGSSPQLAGVSAIPGSILKGISKAVTDIAEGLTDGGRSLTDSPAETLSQQLVFCVSQILPQWDPEDLQVLARPMVHAMRGNDHRGVDSILVRGRLRSIDAEESLRWQELSGVEQARLSLAIAHYALNHAITKPGSSPQQ